MHRLELTPRAQRELDKIRGKDFDRIVGVMQSLRENPRPDGCRKLRRTIYRIRIGNWRIIYSVFDRDNLIIVGKIARRSKRTYDGIDQMF